MPHSLTSRWSTRRTIIVLTLVSLVGGSMPALTPSARANDKTNAATQTPNGSTTRKAASARGAQSKRTNKHPAMTMDTFLDRLMVAESGGNDHARNPLSTATGPFQFIESTFLSVLRRHFPKRVENLNRRQVLALRTNRAIARDAAKAYTRDNATYLVAAGHRPTFPHLRLAFLLGAGGAIRILDAKPEMPLARLVGRGVLRANPWMRKHTARSLIARAARDVSLSPTSLAGAKPYRDPVTGKLIMPSGRIARRPKIRVRCNLARPSCRRWLSLARRKLARKRRNRVVGTAKR